MAASFGVLGGMIIAAPPAGAISSDYTVVWNGTLSPSQLPNAVAGQTFTLDNQDGSQSILVENDTGMASLSGTSCVAGNLTCWVTPGTNERFTIDGPGVVRITKGEFGELAKLTLGAGTSTEPQFVYPTLNLKLNGGTCTGPTQFIKRLGQNDVVYLPTTPEDAKDKKGLYTCTRNGYILNGWARVSNTAKADFQLGQAVAIGTDSFSLYAIWVPKDGVLVTYDSNVAFKDLCWDATGTNIAEDPSRNPARTDVAVAPSTRQVTQPQSLESEPLHTAPCKPPAAVLSAWSTSPLDSGAGFWRLPYKGTKFPLDKPIGASDKGLQVGSAITLYAVWEYPHVKVRTSWWSWGPGFRPIRYAPPIEWGSAVALNGASKDWASDVPTGSAECTEPPLEQDAISFEAQDSLGVPAPHTVLFLGTRNAAMRLVYTELNVADIAKSIPKSRITVQANGMGFLETGDTGETPLTHMLGLGAETGVNDLVIYPCWPTTAKSSPMTDPTLWFISQSDNGVFQSITFNRR